MKPDRSNYEIWFSDWLDGSLDLQQIVELKKFLKDNPDLLEEFNGLSLISLEPCDFVFTGKKNIRRSANDLTDSQFDRLCIANLEDDLSPEQKAELYEIVSENSERKRSFELIQKLKLHPPLVRFGKKSAVKKLTISVITGLPSFRIGAAAAVAALIFLFIFLLRNDSIFTDSSIALAADTLEIGVHPPVLFPVGNPGSAAAKETTKIKSVQVANDSGREIAVFTAPEETGTGIVDSTAVTHRFSAPGHIVTSIPDGLLDPFIPSEGKIIPFYAAAFPEADEDDRSNVERFMASIFHRFIMKDTVEVERPVNSYELAEAGVTGLNRLLGWEMAIHKNTDDDGEVMSYSFSSRLLKFNSPVKKTRKEL